MNAALQVAFQAAIMFLLILVGFFSYKKGVITAKGNKQISNLLVSLVMPVLVFVSLQKEFDVRLLDGLLASAVMAVVSHLLLMGAGVLFIRRENNPNVSVERFALLYSNCAFMGIPLVDSLYGSDGILYLTAYITVFNLLMWTHGVAIMKGEAGLRSAAKAFLSPAVLAVVLGLVCFLLQIFLPPILLRPMEYLAGLNTPLAMIVSGVTIAQTDLKAAFLRRRVYYVQAFKLLIVPVFVLLAFSFLPIPEEVLNTGVLAAACPSATSTIMFSYKFKRNAFYASEQFALSTLLSAATMPFILLLSDTLRSIFM